MQIEIRLEPVYGSGGFREAFPNLSRLFGEYGYTRILEEPPSLYELVDALVRVVNDPKVPERDKAPVSNMLEPFRKKRDEAREALLARRLNDLDGLLYQLEDLYRDLEQAL